MSKRVRKGRRRELLRELSIELHRARHPSPPLDMEALNRAIAEHYAGAFVELHGLTESIRKLAPELFDPATRDEAWAYVYALAAAEESKR